MINFILTLQCPMKGSQDRNLEIELMEEWFACNDLFSLLSYTARNISRSGTTRNGQGLPTSNN